MSPWERGDDFPLTCPKEPSLSESTRGPLPLFPKGCIQGHGVTGCLLLASHHCRVPGSPPLRSARDTASHHTRRNSVGGHTQPPTHSMGPGSLDNKGRLHPASFLGRHPFPFLQERPERSHTNPPSRGGLRAQPGNAQALSSVSFPQQGRELRETVTTGGATAHRANPPFSLPSYQLWLWPRV